MEEKRIRITEAAQAKMKEIAEEGLNYRIMMVNNCWSGPEFRLVQTDSTTEEDQMFQDGEITVYMDKSILPYIEILDIGLFEAYGQEMLLVEENFI